MNIGLITTPVIAGIIGCITNALAIKMLFRPYKAVYIGRFHVPFTPGIIPGQSKRIAASIGRVVSKELLNPEIMEKAMLSDETVYGLKEAFRSKLISYKDDARTIQEAVTEFYPEDKLEGKIDRYRWKTALFIKDKLIEDGIGRKVAEAATKDMLNESLVSRLFKGAIFGVQDVIADTINDFIKEKGVEMIEEELASVSSEILDTKLCDVYDLNEARIPRLVENMENAYRAFIKENMIQMLNVIDIGKIIEERIADFSPEELERASFDVMRKELNAIVYLGAFLGFIIGLVNVAIMSLT